MAASLGKYKAQEVETRTGVAATTLRQWERRYQFPKPERASSGYRLYSDNDVHYIKIMRQHITEGISASRAAELVKSLMARQQHPRSLQVLCQELLEAMLHLDEAKANTILSEAYNLHPVEAVMFEVMEACMVTLGDMWHREEISVATEHFASSYIAGRLRALLNIAGSTLDAACIVIACAPHEYHELGSLMLAVMLRRVGYQIYYLGANMPLAELVSFAREVHADVVMISASTSDTFDHLAEHKTVLQTMAPSLVFGGWVFNENPQLAQDLGGIFLGPDTHKIVDTLASHLKERVRHGSEQASTQHVIKQMSQDNQPLQPSVSMSESNRFEDNGFEGDGFQGSGSLATSLSTVKVRPLQAASKDNHARGEV